MSDRVEAHREDSADVGRGDERVHPADHENGNGKLGSSQDKMQTSGERRGEPVPAVCRASGYASVLQDAASRPSRRPLRAGGNVCRAESGRATRCSGLATCTACFERRLRLLLASPAAACRRRILEVVPSPKHELKAAFDQTAEPTVEDEAVLFKNKAAAQWGIVRRADRQVNPWLSQPYDVTVPALPSVPSPPARSPGLRNHVVSSRHLFGHLLTPSSGVPASRLGRIPSLIVWVGRLVPPSPCPHRQKGLVVLNAARRFRCGNVPLVAPRSHPTRAAALWGPH